MTLHLILDANTLFYNLAQSRRLHWLRGVICLQGFWNGMVPWLWLCSDWVDLDISWVWAYLVGQSLPLIRSCLSKVLLLEWVEEHWPLTFYQFQLWSFLKVYRNRSAGSLFGWNLWVELYLIRLTWKFSYPFKHVRKSCHYLFLFGNQSGIFWDLGLLWLWGADSWVWPS